ncbi:DNA-directed RNA polymerase III subunit RPC6 [Ceratocystis fimbriata CBS 114723]|uniref:DNA-directed RNA polymerase III subunit RPC6 n=1 Tax=Ceratocystis fimbriata CBS 114723 TaxID=1035309 RepID=A0A2C5XJR3_9PEZI|nr:DNA-directed RNA polymerase III subunit RPC6 [Ceratocystis fimbriata CBS 114723]
MSRKRAQAVVPAADVKAEDEATSKVTIYKELLYDSMQANGTAERLYNQVDLQELKAIPDPNILTLLQVVQELVNDKLLVPCTGRDGGLAWKWRDAREAEKYKQCTTPEQKMVYQMIDDSGSDGVWSQTAQKRLGMHENIFKLAIKQLLGKGLIAQFKSVENPNKKMFIKASIRPSEKATGGPWYTDQYLDEAFIEDLERVIYDFVKQRSAYRSRGGPSTGSRTLQPKKGIIKGGEKVARKRTANEISTGDNSDMPPKPAAIDLADNAQAPTAVATIAAPRKDVLLPLPAGYMGYPTVRDIARILSQSGITTNTILSEEDVQKLVDVLEFDGLIERIKVGTKIGYRTVRAVKQSFDQWAVPTEPGKQEKGIPDQYSTPFNEVPCGRCPVFDLCEEGGPVAPSNCEYFKKWLGQE